MIVLQKCDSIVQCVQQNHKSVLILFLEKNVQWKCDSVVHFFL